VGRLEADMDDPAITATLLENTRLARDIGVRGATACSARAAISTDALLRRWPTPASTAASPPADRAS
jgi:hypothetical protein